MKKGVIQQQHASKQNQNNTSPVTKLRGPNDTTISDLIIEEYGDNIIYDSTKKQWRVFSAGRWQEPDESYRIILSFYDAIVLNISNGAYHNRNIVVESKWLNNAMNQSKKAAILKLVQAAKALESKHFDANPNLIGISDLVYDIQAGAARAAAGTDLVLKSLGTTYDANATCPEWDKFLSSIMQGNTEMIGYLQRLVGYFLTTSTKEQEIYYFYGTGANGKSTFLDLVKILLGTYSQKLASETFIKSFGGERSNFTLSNIAKLAGARLALTDETPTGRVAFDTQSLKSISGDDEITGRALYANTITFQSTAKIVMYGNDKPHSDVNDEGFWRRFRFIKFAYIVPEEERDKGLLDKLKDELPGILNWALVGLNEWKMHGLNTPKVVMDDTQSYRTEQDTVSEYLSGNTITEHDVITSTASLFELYEKWCSNNAVEKENMASFSRRAKQYFEKIQGVSPYKNNKMRGYKGVKIS